MQPSCPCSVIPGDQVLPPRNIRDIEILQILPESTCRTEARTRTYMYSVLHKHCRLYNWGLTRFCRKLEYIQGCDPM